jgi:uncharacterized protein YeaO (DUF488 family)
MVKAKRVYDPASPDDGKRILVDRLWPRGIKKERAKIEEWLKDIAPSDELRKWFSHDPAKWPDFEKRYAAELKKKSDLVERLRAEAKKGTITLLFASKEAKYNNTAVLKELIEHR